MLIVRQNFESGHIGRGGTRVLSSQNWVFWDNSDSLPSNNLSEKSSLMRKVSVYFHLDINILI